MGKLGEVGQQTGSSTLDKLQRSCDRYWGRYRSVVHAREDKLGCLNPPELAVFGESCCSGSSLSVGITPVLSAVMVRSLAFHFLWQIVITVYFTNAKIADYFFFIFFFIFEGSCMLTCSCMHCRYGVGFD